MVHAYTVEIVLADSAVCCAGSLGGAAAQAVDPNEAMAWELLYNLSWQLPTEELEGAWKDATGQTAVMKVSS